METSRRLRIRRCRMNRHIKRYGRGDWWGRWRLRRRMEKVDGLLAFWKGRREGRTRPPKTRFCRPAWMRDDD